jgi:hypothetical protein
MVQKIHQIVWIPADQFSQVASLSASVNKAPNVIISELVSRALKNEWAPLKVIEKEKIVPQKRYICKDCLQEFLNLQEARVHQCAMKLPGAGVAQQ